MSEPRTPSIALSENPDTALASIESLHSNIAHASAWTVAEHVTGTRYYPSVHLHTTAQMEHLPDNGYSEADMAQIDVRLPEALKAMTSHDPVSHVNAANLRATLQLWNGQLQALDPHMFDSSTHLDYITADSFAVLMREVPDGDDMVLARFLGYVAAKTQTGVAYIGKCYHPNFAVSPQWLDEQRPGWQKLVLLAETLALPDTDFAQLLLFAPIKQDTPNTQVEPDTSASNANNDLDTVDFNRH